MKKYFKLFSNCVLARGASYSTISDLQRGRIQLIPNELFDLLEVQNEISYPNDNATINEYLEFFIAKEFGFVCSEQEKAFFPPLELAFELPKEVYNIVVDFDKKIHPIESMRELIEEVKPIWVAVRFFTDLVLEAYIDILDGLERVSYPISIDLCLPYSRELDSLLLKELARKYYNVSQVLFHSSPPDKEPVSVQGAHISYTDITVNSEKCCGVINREGFAVNLHAVSEAKHFNSCLNGKLAIDKDGNIKNCPSMSKSYGHLSEISYADLLKQKDFTKIWKISKDKIKICQDCEFRYVCTDCRAYLDDPNDELSKPLKCGYDPYQGEWFEWSTNPLKQAVIAHYEMGGIG
jgi:SPASM domain peptide maturase of grasp-with-spasm system